MQAQVGKVDLNLSRSVEEISTPVDLTPPGKTGQVKKFEHTKQISLTDFGKDVWLATASVPYGPMRDMHVAYCERLQASGLMDKKSYHHFTDARFTDRLKQALENPYQAVELYEVSAGQKDRVELLKRCFDGL